MQKKVLSKIKDDQKEEIELFISTLFKVLMLLVGFMQTSCITFGKHIISYVLWPTVFLGGIILLYRLVKIKNYYKSRGFIFLVLFCISFIISALLFRKYGIYKNIRTFVWIAFQFGILYLYDVGKEKEYYRRQIEIVSNVFLSVTFILTFISIFELFIGYSYTVLQENGPHIVHGFTWGRLFGAYWDPNIASVIVCISIIMALNKFKLCKKNTVKILYVLFIILQIIYVVFSDSRTGKLCFIVGITLYSLLRCIQELMNKHDISIKKKISITTSIVLITIILTIIVPIGIKRIYNGPIRDLIAFIQREEPKDGEKKETKNIAIGRGYDISSDITNRRADIWNSVLDILKKEPIFGVSRNNIIPYVRENIPDTYIINNDQMDFSSMHNLTFDILASQGFVGLAIFFTFAGTCIVLLIKNLKGITQDFNDYFPMLICVIATIVASTVVMTEIIYVDSPISTVFWIYLSNIIFSCSKNKIDKKEV